MGSMPAHVRAVRVSLSFVVTVARACITGALETSCLTLCRFMLDILCFVTALGVLFWVIALEISRFQVGRYA